jgi:UDP-glucuronate 4-epimerase
VKVLVTGAAGFIGSALTEELLKRNFDVYGIDCFLENSYDPKIKANRAKYLEREFNFQIDNLDLRHDSLDGAIKNADVIVNLAAMPGLIKSWSEFDVYVNCNLVAVERILKNKNFSASKFIQASTSSVYGMNAIGNELSECKPYSPYGVSKLAAENLLHAYGANFGVKYSILRYFSVYGPGQRPDMAYSKFCDWILQHKPVIVYGDGTDTRSNTYISDCVNATINAIVGSCSNQIYNISGSQQIDVKKAIEIIADELQLQPQVVNVEKRPGDQKETKGDSSRAQRELNFLETVGIEEGLRRQARHHKLFSNGASNFY